MFWSEAFKRAQHGIRSTRGSVGLQIGKKWGLNRDSILVKNILFALLNTVGAGSVREGGKDAAVADFIPLCNETFRLIVFDRANKEMNVEGIIESKSRENNDIGFTKFSLNC